MDTHREERPVSVPLTQPPPSVFGQNGCRENLRSHEQMVMDVAGPSFSPNDEQSMDETPNEKTQAFYNLLAASQ